MIPEGGTLGGSSGGRAHVKLKIAGGGGSHVKLKAMALRSFSASSPTCSSSALAVPDEPVTCAMQYTQ